MIKHWRVPRVSACLVHRHSIFLGLSSAWFVCFFFAPKIHRITLAYGGEMETDGEKKKTDTFRRQSHREINEFRILSSFTSPLKTQINTFLSLARSLAINFHFNHSFLHKQMEFFSIEKFSNSESWWMCLYDFYCYIKEVEWKQKWNRLNKVLVRNELREKEEGQIDTDNV